MTENRLPRPAKVNLIFSYGAGRGPLPPPQELRRYRFVNRSFFSLLSTIWMFDMPDNEASRVALAEAFLKI